MRVANVSEFRDHAPEFLSGDDLVFVTKHGKVSSLLVPMSKPRELPLELRRELLTSLGSAISDHLKKTGFSERTVKHDFEKWGKSRRTNHG